MPRNITPNEYTTLLRQVCPAFGNVEGADIDAYRAPHWESMARHMTCSITLDMQAHDFGKMRPVLKVGSSSWLPSDPLAALAYLKSNQDTLMRAMQALTMLGSVTVWLRDCPCDCCGGRGTLHGKACSRCGGAKVRNDPKESNDE